MVNAEVIDGNFGGDRQESIERSMNAEMIAVLRNELPADLIEGVGGAHIEVESSEKIDEDDREEAAYLVHSFVGLRDSKKYVERAMSAPGVARGIVDILSSEEDFANKNLSGVIGYVIDLLPLEAQVQIMGSKNAPHILEEVVGHVPSGKEKDSLVAKFSTILQWRLKKGDAAWVDDFIVPCRSMLDFRYGFTGLGDNSIITSQLECLKDEMAEYVGVEKQLDLALKMSNVDEVADFLVSNPESAANMNAAQAYLLNRVSRESGGVDTEEQILSVIPAPMQALIDKIYVGGSNQDDKMARLREMTTSDAKEKLDRIAELESEQNQNILSQLWITSIDDKVVFDGADNLLEEIVRNWPLEADVIKEIRRNVGRENWEEYIEKYGFAPVLSLEEVKNPKQMYLRHAEEFAEQGNSSEVRNELCKGLYGVDVEELAMRLISVGVIALPYRESGIKNIVRGEGLTSMPDIGIFTAKIDEAQERGAISEGEKRILLESIRLLSTNKNYGEFFEIMRERPDGETGALRTTLKRLTENSRRLMTENINEATQRTLEDSTEEVDSVEYGGKTIPVRKMVGDEFMVLGTIPGVFSHKKDAVNNPERWNRDHVAVSDEARVDDSCVSASLFCDGKIKIAYRCHSPEDLHKASTEDGLFMYAFTDLGENGVLHAANYDLYTGVDENGVDTGRQDYFYDDLRELIAQTDDYNEVALDRFAKKNEVDAPFGGRLQPNYIVCFARDASEVGELAKKHAAYFDVPIVMIDPWRYWGNSATLAKYEQEKELQKNKKMGSKSETIYERMSPGGGRLHEDMRPAI